MGAVLEDDDDWLQGYLATTAYGSDSKLTSNPVRPKKEEKKEKKLYKLQPTAASRNSRRKSWAATQMTSKIVPRVEVLPDRVNAIRDANEVEVPPPAGHFVREHRKSKEHPADEFTVGGSRKVAKSGVDRRRSLDYDELDAVKHRVMQAAQVWEQREVDAEDSEELRDDLIPASLLTSAPVPAQTMMPEKKVSGKSWLMRKWAGKMSTSPSS